jgi:hypothetical protein
MEDWGRLVETCISHVATVRDDSKVWNLNRGAQLPSTGALAPGIKN